MFISDFLWLVNLTVETWMNLRKRQETMAGKLK